MSSRWAVFAVLIIGSHQALADSTLAEKSGCFECHSTTRSADRRIGPSFAEIAARYRDNPAARKALINVLKKGGKKNWISVSGGVPMPPYSPRLSDEEIGRLVDWVLRP